MQGKLVEADQLKEDEVMKTILCMLCSSAPAPTHGYYHAGVLGPELHFLENIINARCAAPAKPRTHSKSSYLVNFVAFIVSAVLLL